MNPIKVGSNDAMARELSPKQQIVDLIKKSQRVLVLTHVRPDCDAVSSAIAMKLILEKMGKKADVVMPEGVGDTYKFLPHSDIVSDHLELNRDVVVKINSATGKVGKISYNKEGENEVRLVISPASGSIAKEDLTIEHSGSPYDLVVVLDAGSLDRISEAFGNNKDAFQGVPLVVIDHHVTNNYFGDVNLIDSTATATAEILVSIIEALDKTFLDKEIATLLLAGILTDTNRFQNANTTPKSLTVAAQLIAAGAQRYELIKNLYKTHSVDILKAWGAILSNIKEDKENKIVWSSLSAHEVEKNGFQNTNFGEIVSELMMTAPTAEIFMLLVDRGQGLVTGSIRTTEDSKSEADKICLLLGGGGHKQASGFKMEGKSLAEVEKIAFEKIYQYLGLKKPVVATEENVKKEEVIFEQPVIMPAAPKKEEPKEIQQKVRQETSSDDDLYAPSISDIDLDAPKVVESKGSILDRVIKSREEKINFSELEQKARQERPHVVVNDWDEDEDFE